MKKLIKKYKVLPIQVKASLWFLICAFLQKGISMLSTPIFTRILTTTEYGQYNVFNSWMGVVAIFVSMSLAGGVYTQGLIKFECDRFRFSSSLQGLSTTLVILWTIIYLIAHNFWNSLFSLSTVQMLAMFAMIWTTAVFNFWSNEQRVSYQYMTLVFVTLLISIFKPLVGIVFVSLAKDKVTARILGLMIVEFVGYIGLYIVQMIRGKCFYSKKYWIYALRFNMPLLPHYLSQTVLSSSDRIMISKMIGDSESGIYSLASSLSMIMMLFNNALIQTLNPWVYQKIQSKKIKDIEPIAYMSLTIIAVVNVVLILFAPEAVVLFAPQSYYDAIWVIPPITMSAYFLFSYDLFAKFAFYYEKTNLIMFASVIGALINIVLNYIFIQLFGYIAAGYTTLICYMIYSAAHYVLMNRICKKYCDGITPYQTQKIMKITVLFLGVGFLLLVTYNHAIIRYSMMIIAIVIMVSVRKKILSGIKELVSIRNPIDKY